MQQYTTANSSTTTMKTAKLCLANRNGQDTLTHRLGILSFYRGHCWSPCSAIGSLAQLVGVA